MGLFIEDLLNLGNLMDAELEIKLSKEHLNSAYPGLSFELNDGLLILYLEKKGLIFKKKKEIRLAEESTKVKNDKERGKRYILLKPLTQNLKDLQDREEFTLEGDFLGFDVWEAVKLTETYQKIPRQFKDLIFATRYKIRKDALSVFFKVEKVV